MKNYVQEGENITVVAPYALASGDGCLVGSIFGFSQLTVAIGAAASIVTWGVFDGKKTAGDTPAAGAVLYWDNAAKSLTTTAGGNKRVGCALLAALAGDATVRIRLEGVAT